MSPNLVRSLPHLPIPGIRVLLAIVLLACALASVASTTPTRAAQPDAGTPALEMLSGGSDHICALRSNGAAWCWGKASPAEVNPAAGLLFRQIGAAGNLHSCGVLTDGTVRCWGFDGDDQSSPPNDEFRQVSTGGRHTCGVRADGTLACWGADDRGQSTPPAGRFRQVSAGDSHTCAVAADGSIACWGSDNAGQLQVLPGTYLSVSAGFGHTCGLRTDGTAACWGSDDSGQTEAPTDRLVSVSAGYNHSCGLAPDGRAVCWGHDAYGESTVPVERFEAVSAGYLTTCAVTAGGSVMCWGYDTWEEALSQAPGPVGRWTVGSGAHHSCAVASDSKLTCWGAADAGQDQVPSGTWRQLSIGDASSCALGTDGITCWGPSAEGSLPSAAARQVATSDTFGCAIAADGSLTCWGADDAGQATPPAGSFVAVATGGAFGCAIAGDGTLQCWGANDAGQATPPAGTFIALSAGPSTACAIAADGTLQCWGANDTGQATPPAGSSISVGVGTTQACAVAANGTTTCWGTPPTDETPPTRALVTQVSVGDDHACVIAENGILDCWGVNDVGQADPPVPGAPVATTTVGPQVVAEDGLLELTLPADLFTDTQPLTWSAGLADGSDLPAWLRFDPGARLLSGTPADGDVGQLTVAITATDPDGLTGTTTFTLDITNTNDPPLVGKAIPDQDATEDSLWTFVIPEGTFVDDDLDSGDALTLAMSLPDGSVLPAWLRFDAQSGTISGTPSRDDIGQLSLAVVATDLAGESVQTFMNVRIARVNHPPTVATAIKEQKAIQDQEFTFTFPRDTFDEQDQDDSLVYDATQKDGTPLPSWLAFARSDRTFRGTPRNTDVGTLVITVTATDKLGASAATDFALRVVNVNDSPQLVSRIPDQTIDQDQPFSFTLSSDLFTDPDLVFGDTLHLRAAGAEGAALPLWLSFDADTWTFQGTPRDADAGRTVITVTATDAAGDEAAGSFTLTVEDVNDAPQVSQPTPDQVAPVGQRFELVLDPDMFIDADIDIGDAFVVTALREDRSPLPAWLTFDAETLAFAGVPTDADAGQLAVSVIATDSQAAEGVDTFVITVEPPRDQPSEPVAAMRRGQMTSAGAVPMIITWSAGREVESGTPRYGLEVRTQGRKGWGKYQKLATVSGRTGATRSMKPGTYQLRIRALVRGQDPGPWIEGQPFKLTVLGEADPSIEYTGRWTKAARKDATKGTVRRSSRPGDSLSLTATATSLGIVASTGDGQGQIDVCVDPTAESGGTCRTVDLSRGRKSGRTLATVLRDLSAGEHQLTVTVRQAPVDIDAIVLLEPLPVEPAASPAAPEASAAPS